MSINSIQLLVKGLLQDLPLPTTPTDTLIAICTPPTTDDRTDPRAYIWGSIGAEKRRTFARGPGFKDIIHQLDIWVIWFGDATDPNADSQFPIVLEEIMNELRTTLMPVLNLVDPATGRTSNVDAIGEDMRWDYSPVHAIADQGIFRYDGRIVATIKEMIRA